MTKYVFWALTFVSNKALAESKRQLDEAGDARMSVRILARENPAPHAKADLEAAKPRRWPPISCPGAFASGLKQ